MTCIVGAKDVDGRLWLGGDSCCSEDTDKLVTNMPKVWKVSDFLIGFCGSLRVGGVAAYAFNPPAHVEGLSDNAYIIGPFITSLRECLHEHGIESIDDTHFSSFLVGYHNTLYIIYEEWSAHPVVDSLVAIGSGSRYAIGAGFEWDGTNPKGMVTKALRAATKFDTAVSQPFTIVKSDVATKRS